MVYLNRLQYFPYWALVVITIVLTLPALFSGWLGDDYIHYALLHPDIDIPPANDWSLFGLFSWVDASPERTQVLIDRGVIPWWTYEGFRYQFWRPLAELSHWLDHQLWRNSALMMHVHSLVLYLGLGAALQRLYSRMQMSPLAVAGALAVYLWDSTHGLSLSWVANRNAIMASLFGVLCLLWYLDWRDTGGLRTLLVSLFWLLCSLFSGELGISTCAYLGAYALMADKAGPGKALIALWPYVVISIAWWLLYKLGNFGADNSDTNYIDPLESPLIFLSKVWERIPVLLFAQFGLIPADVFGFNPKGMVIFSLFSLFFVALVFLVLLPLLKRSPEARFWALGCLLAAGPVSSTIPADRNLMMVGIGASALLGMLFEAVTLHQITSRVIRFGAYALFAIHLILSPLLMPLFSYSPQVWSRLMGLQATQTIPIESNRERVLLFGVSMPIALATTPMRFAHKQTVAEKLWLISSDPMKFIIQRVSASVLIIESEHGMVNEFEQTVRDLSRQPLEPGFQVHTESISIEVLELDPAGHPNRLRVQFDPEHMDSIRVIYWNGKAFQRSELPAIGKEMLLRQATK